MLEVSVAEVMVLVPLVAVREIFPAEERELPLIKLLLLFELMVRFPDEVKVLAMLVPVVVASLFESVS